MTPLTDDQKTALHTWAAEGATLNDIQKRLKTDFDINLTYMETRFLASDLELVLRDPVAEAKKKDEAAAAAKALEEAASPATHESKPATAGDGSVSVSVDSITQPGTIVSGSVTFSDGKSGRWYLDQMGQLGFDAEVPGYRPSEPDAIAFEKQLHQVLEQQR